jgi:hypothetical protein
METEAPGRFFLICLPFAHHANGSLSFVHLLTNKKGLNGLAHLWSLWHERAFIFIDNVFQLPFHLCASWPGLLDEGS